MEPIPTPPDPFTVADSGALTIGDLPAIFAVVFFVPGDWLLWSIAAHVPAAAGFLAIGPDDFGGPLSAGVSALAWSASLVIAAIAYRAIRDFDDALTGAIVKGWNDARTRARIAWRLTSYRVQELGKRRRAAASRIELDAEELVLDDAALKLLRALASPAAGRGLQLRDAAALLRGSKRDAHRVLERLRSLQLARLTTRTADGEQAYVLTAAGRGFLLFRQLVPPGAAQPKRAGP